MNLEPRAYESETHEYAIDHLVPGEKGPVKFERVLLNITNKKTDRSLQVMFPVIDCGVVGDLVAGVYLEREGYERKEVTPEELREGDTIEGLGPIVEIENILTLDLDMIKVMVDMPRKPGMGPNKNYASVLFTRVISEGVWPSNLGITRRITKTEHDQSVTPD